MRSAFLATDAEYLSTPRQEAGRDSLSGSTAVAVVVQPGRCLVANLGDSRAVLVRSGGGAVQLTNDHKPYTESERARIEAAGGEVSERRVSGILSMSRAIGDRMLKTFVIAEPDVTERSLGPQDAFLILGTDGLWDFISNEDAAAVVRPSALPLEPHTPGWGLDGLIPYPVPSPVRLVANDALRDEGTGWPHPLSSPLARPPCCERCTAR